MNFTYPKLPLLGSPQITIIMNNKIQQEFKIQIPNCPITYPCPQCLISLKQCNMPTPLNYPLCTLDSIPEILVE